MGSLWFGGHKGRASSAGGSQTAAGKRIPVLSGGHGQLKMTEYFVANNNPKIKMILIDQVRFLLQTALQGSMDLKY